MKKIFLTTAGIIFAAMTVCPSDCSAQESLKDKEQVERTAPLFGLGEYSDQFTGKAWTRQLSSVSDFDCRVYNVTFAPGTRNNWHSHQVGQILLCTDGIGYYQEKGKPARRLEPGSVVDIPAGTVHWHGASPDSRFTHVAISPKVTQNGYSEFGPVTDDEYKEATKE